MKYLREFSNGKMYCCQSDSISFYHISDFKKIEFVEDIEFRWTKTKEHAYITPVQFDIIKYYKSGFDCLFLNSIPDNFYYITLFQLLKNKSYNLKFKTQKYELILYNINAGDSYQRYELLSKEDNDLNIPYAIFEKRPSEEMYKLQQ